ncbi:MAG: GntR family transcriptional regulator [Eubacteriales bacterium]|nr:GntR family transcriptional regulator [Eubacteriales bacterium]
MTDKFAKLNKDTLKQQFIKEMQRMIISGELKEGQRLPSERDLSSALGISRGIVNAGIVELSAKGLLRIVPRIGTFVSKFEEDGTICALELLMNYSDGKINEPLFLDMIEVKRQLESRCAYLAAKSRTEPDLDEMKKLRHKIFAEDDLDRLTELNFLFHHRIALSTHNTVYTLLDKSFEPVSKNIIRYFYSQKGVAERSKQLLSKIYESIKKNDAENAAKYTADIFDTAERIIKEI